MDTKLKNIKQNRIFGIIISIIFIVFISGCIVASYPIVLRNAEKLMKIKEEDESSKLKAENNYYKRQFIEKLYKGNYVLYMNCKQEVNDNQRPSEVFLNYNLQTLPKSKLRDYVYEYDYALDYDYDYNNEYDYIVDPFDSVIENWFDDFYSVTLENLPSLQYYIIDESIGTTLTNSIDPLHILMEDTEEAKKLKESYPFFIIFKYLDDGSLQILDYAGIEQEFIDEYKRIELNKSVFKNEYDDKWWYKYKGKIKTPTSTTIIYASDTEDFYVSDSKSHYRFSPDYYFYQAGLKYIYFISIVLVLLLAIFLPLKKSWGIGKGLSSKIPFEVNVLVIAFVIDQYPLALYMAWETAGGYYISEPEETIIPKVILRILDYCINFTTWMFLLMVIFISFLSIRQIFTLGFKRYLKEKTLIGRFSVWIYGKLKKLILSLSEIDLSDPSNKSIAKILAVNFVILLILCCLWVFGIFLLIIYTIILFFVLRNYFVNIKRKYQILLQGTISIAEGNLEHPIDEDLGIFESLKDELTKVQYGFRKAVEEEMKSQRMKTDLITNVSHDLKTPLTAIITYVNLMKDDNISEEERKSYIETLDKKSQRLKILIDDLFEISKASSNNITIDPVDIDLVDLIKQVLLEMDDKIREARIEFKFNPPMEKLILSLDSEKTYRIFENLIVNITKYGMTNTRAYIDIIKEDEVTRIILKNISASELNFSIDELSERFVRGDQARNTDGSGLGLAIVKSFVELQGGKFQIETDGDLFKAIIEWNNKI